MDHWPNYTDILYCYQVKLDLIFVADKWKMNNSKTDWLIIENINLYLITYVSRHIAYNWIYYTDSWN